MSSDLSKAWNELKAAVKAIPAIHSVHKEARQIDQWEIASAHPPPYRDTNALREAFNTKYPIRMGRLNSDYRWLQRKMKKMGFNPEDARWIL